MIKSIKTYFETLLSKDHTPRDGNEFSNTLELATAVLMIEIGIADNYFDDEERKTVAQLLINTFSMESEKIEELITIAEQEVDHATSLYEFTRLLVHHLSIKERIKIIENLWRVAYADGVLNKYEEYYIRKVADLLYIAHADYIKAKHDAAK